MFLSMWTRNGSGMTIVDERGNGRVLFSVDRTTSDTDGVPWKVYEDRDRELTKILDRSVHSDRRSYAWFSVGSTGLYPIVEKSEWHYARKYFATNLDIDALHCMGAHDIGPVADEASTTAYQPDGGQTYVPADGNAPAVKLVDGVRGLLSTARVAPALCARDRGCTGESSAKKNASEVSFERLYDGCKPVDAAMIDDLLRRVQQARVDLAPSIDMLRKVIVQLLVPATLYTDAWPVKVAELLRRGAPDVASWIYNRLYDRALGETARKLEEIVESVGKHSARGHHVAGALATLLDIDHSTRRNPGHVVTEAATGFIASKRQMLFLASIATGSAHGAVRQFPMGGGKTSFIIPNIVADCLMSDHSNNVVVVVPHELVQQTASSVKQVVAAFEPRMVSVFGNKVLTTSDLYKYIRRFSSDRRNDWRYGGRWGSREPVAVSWKGRVTVISDKALQLMHLTAQTSRGSISKDAVYAELRKSIVVCDEIDTVIDPLSCEFNMPDQHSEIASPPHDALVAQVVRRMQPDPPSEASDIVNIALSKKYNRDYGFGTTEDTPAGRANVVMAIPYRGANAPRNGARFSSDSLRTALTVAAYVHAFESAHEFRPVDVCELFDTISAFVSEGDAVQTGTLKRILPSCPESVHEAMARYGQGASAADVAKTISDALADRTTWTSGNVLLFAAQCATAIIRRYTRTFQRQHSVGMLEFLSANTTRRCIMFSGTVNVPTISKADEELIRSWIRDDSHDELDIDDDVPRGDRDDNDTRSDNDESANPNSNQYFKPNDDREYFKPNDDREYFKPDDDEPTDQKPDDDEPTDQKPDDDEPTDQKPDDDEPTDQKPDDDEPTDQKPDDDAHMDRKPDEDGPMDQKPDRRESDDGNVTQESLFPVHQSGVVADPRTASIVSAVISGYACPSTANATESAYGMPVVIGLDTSSVVSVEASVISAVGTLTYGALIDAGGVMCNERPQRYAEMLAKYRATPTAVSDRDVLFVRDGERLVRDGATESVAPCTSMLGRPRPVLVFYDQRSTVGIEFEQPVEMRGLVTVACDTTLTELSQAVFRLRRQTVGHAVDFLFVYNARDAADVEAYRRFTDPETRMAFLEDNEVRRVNRGSALWTLQCVASVVRTHKSARPLAYSRDVWVGNEEDVRSACMRCGIFGANSWTLVAGCQRLGDRPAATGVRRRLMELMMDANAVSALVSATESSVQTSSSTAYANEIAATSDDPLYYHARIGDELLWAPPNDGVHTDHALSERIRAVLESQFPRARLAADALAWLVRVCRNLWGVRISRTPTSGYVSGSPQEEHPALDDRLFALVVRIPERSWVLVCTDVDASAALHALETRRAPGSYSATLYSKEGSVIVSVPKNAPPLPAPNDQLFWTLCLMRHSTADLRTAIGSIASIPDGLRKHYLVAGMGNEAREKTARGPTEHVAANATFRVDDEDAEGEDGRQCTSAPRCCICRAAARYACQCCLVSQYCSLTCRVHEASSPDAHGCIRRVADGRMC
jgi:hypothetical protein